MAEKKDKSGKQLPDNQSITKGVLKILIKESIGEVRRDLDG